MSLYATIKTLYKTVVPNAVRRAIFRMMPRRLRIVRDSFIRRLQRSADYDTLYDKKYYTDGLDAAYKESCEVIAESIVKAFAPGSAVDVGCGPGELLMSLGRRGVVCRGLECSSAALKICRQNGLNVTRFDLTCDTLPEEFRSDVVVSTEVAEHLPEECADRFVDILCAIADDVVMTAAEPAATYVGDHTHVNEQPREYWIDKFRDRGFTYNEEVTHQFRTEWKEAGVKPWFVRHLIVFHKERCRPR